MTDIPHTSATAPHGCRSLSPAAVTLLRISGEDAFGYLQSQVSADLRDKRPQWVRYALWLNAKGQVQADCFILRESAESFLLLSYHTGAAELTAIAEANIIADDVQIESIGAGWQHWSLWRESPFNAAADEGNCAADICAALPETGTFTCIDLATGSPFAAGQQQRDATAAQIPAACAVIFAGRGGAAGCSYDLLLPAGAELPAAFAALEAQDWNAREAFRIRSGIAAVPADIGAGDLPQEGGDLIAAAVSTAKGCYLGQEVIAHWDATRQVRSALYRLWCNDGETQGAGAGMSATVAAAAGSLPARLYAGSKPVGELRSFSVQAGCGLALLKIHRLGEVRELSLEPSAEPLLRVEERPLA